MENINKISLLKELEFYSRLLEKHEALKKEKEFKLATSQQANSGQLFSKPKFDNYKFDKNQSNPCLSQNYFFKKPTHRGLANQNRKNDVYHQNQNFHSKCLLSKNKVLNGTTSTNNFTVNNCKSKDSVVCPKSIAGFKSDSIKPPSVSLSKAKKPAFNAKDFIREIESIEALLKKKTSGSPNKNLNSASKCKHVTQNKQISPKPKQNNAFDNLNFVKKEKSLSKAGGLVEMPSKTPANINSAIRKKYSINSTRNNSLQQKTFNSSKFIYKKYNVKSLLNENLAATPKDDEDTAKTKNSLRKVITKPASRKVFFCNSKNVSQELCASSSAGVFQRQHLSSVMQELSVKLQTPIKSNSNRKALKKSPQVMDINSATLCKKKSPAAPNLMKLKQTNTRYKKVNKNLTTPNQKRMQLRHSTQERSSIKKTNKKVDRYKVVNKILTPRSDRNILCSEIDKKKFPLSVDCDTFLKNFRDSAVDKLEQNLLAMTSELTDPFLSKEGEICDSDVVEHSLTKVNSKIVYKKTPSKKPKSRISKYKIINSSSTQKYSLTNRQSVRLVTPPKRERVLVRRLFKSKNVIINKNATPTNYRAKMIKSKYLLLNKRKSFSSKYVQPTVSMHPRFKGPFLTTKLHPKQNRFKTNVISMHPCKIRGKNYACEIYKNKQFYKKNGTRGKTKINNRFTHSPVVFIRGTRYAKNLNGKTLRKLPSKGQTVRHFQRASSSFIKRTSENSIKASPASMNLASRVLHRSINRILIASSKKSLSKVNTYCMFYNRFGRCNRGVKCSYIHDPSKIAICTRFLRGTCKIDGCPFSHEVDPGKMAICSFFLVGQCDKENCLYRHEKLSPNSVLCKDFVQGYCHYGKECKKAHILLCPKYVQGECDKGSLCAFPHPPQKAKKNNHKEVEDEATKPTEVLLEVLRYFQQGGNSQNEKSPFNLFVPQKRKKLEEQPSFIPLSASPAVTNKNK